MEGGEGMVAVVRGLKDSGLTVTLLDGGRQYTLMPNDGSPQFSNNHLKHDVASPQTDAQDSEQPARSDSVAQATDGRYASTYKMAHCRVSPTSPPVQLTEFPPQRPEITRGQGNFEVGGNGSGERYTPCKSNGSFRGGMCWPDRGSVFSPRPSREPDAFANSLRKYPNISAERSTEIVERLINYTQAKHSARSSRHSSPSRQVEQNVSSQYASGRRTNGGNSLEESPTRDIRPQNRYNESEYADNRPKNSNAKCVMDDPKRITNNVHTMSSCVHNQPVYYQAREAYDPSLYAQKASSILTAANSVNMEVQAAVEMVSREVAAVPKTQTTSRTVAVPLSPATSNVDQKQKGEVSIQVAIDKFPKKPALNYTYVQTAVKDGNPLTKANSCSVELSNLRSEARSSSVTNGKSKSEEKVITYSLEDELLNLLERVSVCPTADPETNSLRRKVLKIMSYRLHKLSKKINNPNDGEKAKNLVGKMLKYVPVWVPYGDVQAYRDAISDKIIDKIRQYNNITQVYRASVPSFLISSRYQALNNIIKDWVNSLPIKVTDLPGMLGDKCNLVEKYVNKIQRIILRKLRDDTNDELRAELLKITSEIPMNVHTSHKLNYLNQVITSLINNVHTETRQSSIGNRKYLCYNIDNVTKRYIQPTEDQLYEITANHLNVFFRNNNLFVDVQRGNYFQTELIDILGQSMDEINVNNNTDVIEEIVLLLGETGSITENKARHFANEILAHIRTIIDMNYKNTPVNTQSQNYVVLQNKTRNQVYPSTTTKSNFNLGSQQDHLDGEIDKDNFDMDIYLNQLMQQIDEWLKDSQVEIPYANDSAFRQIVINDLADDIIDRQKYLELSHSSRGSEEDEIEHLKYQIFKWINKLAGEENLEILDHAPELMKRIQNIFVPEVTLPYNDHKNQSSLRGCMMEDCLRSTNYKKRKMSNQVIVNTDLESPNTRESFNKVVTPVRQSTSSCCNGVSTNHGLSVKVINEEYDEFLKSWVKEIPIPSTSPEQQEIKEKARQGIYNGVWKILTKLKLDTVIFHNVFYYEDALDDELEELFQCLPDTTELKAKKHLLKVKLIEKTTITNEMIKKSLAPASFRQQLVENVVRDLPTNSQFIRSFNKSKQTFEDQQIEKVVDDYILCINLRENNQPRAEVYRKKLIKEAHVLIKHIKKTHDKELKDIDSNLYLNNVLNALHKVPIPNEAVLEKEAKEIQLNKEVNNWFADLQVIHKMDIGNGQDTRKLKNVVIKKILELEKNTNILDCSGEKTFKHEISLLLKKMHIEGKNINLTFIAEELTNRLKNKAKDYQISNTNCERKSVGFLDSVGYYEFSLQMPACSSFSEMPLRPAIVDQSSYMIKDGSKMKIPPPSNLPFGIYRDSNEIPSNEFYTLEDSKAPKKQTVDQIKGANEYFQANMNNLNAPNPYQRNEYLQRSRTAQNYPSHQYTIRSDDLKADMSYIRQSLDREPGNAMVQAPITIKSRYSRNSQELTMSKLPIVLPQQYNEDLINTTSPTSAQPAYNSMVGKNTINNTSPSNNPCCQGIQGTNRADSTQKRDCPSIHPLPNIGLGVIAATPTTSEYHHQTAKSIQQPQYSTDGADHLSNNRNLPGSITTYGEPQGFSTPQNQGITREFPPRIDRKNSRRQEWNQEGFAQKRLELIDDTNNAAEKDELCPCFKRMWRCRREPMCNIYEDFERNEQECYPFPYSCPHY